MTLFLLTEKVKKSNPSFDVSFIEKAFRFAEEAHQGKSRKSGEEFIQHPLAVAIRLAEWRLDPAAIAAALLHDVAEDSPYTQKDIEKHFGKEVAFLVEAVTKLKTIRFTDASERSAENLRKMVLAFAQDIRVLLIKLLDHLHNMETISYLDQDEQKRIARETIEIYAPLANRLGIGELKGQLEDLAFPIIYPEEHQWLMGHVKEPMEERRAYVERLIPYLKELLGKENVPSVDIHARAKHWYSLWRKLQRHEMSIENIYDLVAVRAILPTLEHCYTVLGAVHANFPPLPGRIKDYIALPKSNGYRSLHTTVVGPEGKIVEIQIRTPEMHQEAESGIAAHWAYSEEESNEKRHRGAKTLQHSRDVAWIKQLRDWHARFEDPNEFLESLKIDFFKDRIFVFTPKGEVIDLPEGSTPVDFAYHIHSDIGDQATGAKINGKMIALDTSLKNGDVVEILIQKNKKPSSQWLEFVKTSLARKHIQSYLKK